MLDALGLGSEARVGCGLRDFPDAGTRARDRRSRGIRTPRTRGDNGCSYLRGIIRRDNGCSYLQEMFRRDDQRRYVPEDAL